MGTEMKTATTMQIKNLQMKAQTEGDMTTYNMCVRALAGSAADLKTVSEMIAAAQSGGGMGYGAG
jgi:hypothetical protein